MDTTPPEVCTDDHSSRTHCPVHGFDPSAPAPDGFFWHNVARADGQTYTALVGDPDHHLALIRRLQDYNLRLLAAASAAGLTFDLDGFGQKNTTTT